MEKLLNCPFCGGNAEIRYYNDDGETLETDDGFDAVDVDYYSVACIGCDAITDLRMKFDDAVARWNRRATDLEELAREVEKRFYIPGSYVEDDADRRQNIILDQILDMIRRKAGK